MKITIDIDAIIARVKDRRAREGSLRERGVAVFRDWAKRRAQRTPAFTIKKGPGGEAR